MFCTSCGAKIGDGANFCTSCGARLGTPPIASQPTAQPAPPAPAAQPTAPPQPTAPQPPHTGSVKCEWCGAVVDASLGSCPKCGATLNVREAKTRSGWGLLPGRKDMAKLQFGNSSCQIEGIYVPTADFNLAASDSIYFTHHVLLWKDPQVDITTMSLKGGWKRLFAGMPLIMTQAQGPGHIAFSRDAPGELIAVPLQPGETIDVREHLFLSATSSVEYDWFMTNLWFKTRRDNDTETHYPIGMFMDRFAASNVPGLLLLHAAGNVFVRDLAPNQSILIKPTALVFKDTSVNMHLHFEQPGMVFGGTSFGLFSNWSNRYLWLRLIGPGRVAVQSVFERVEGESGNISGFSYATEQYW